METLFFMPGEICFLCNQSCDELDEENQEHHRDWIDRRIGDAGSGTVAHRVGGSKSGVLVIPPAIVPIRSRIWILNTK